MSKKNYTHYLNSEIVEKAYSYASENGKKNGEVIEHAINVVYGDAESENEWMDRAHGYEIENVFLRKELKQMRDIFVSMAAKMNGDESAEPAELLTDALASYISIKKEV